MFDPSLIIMESERRAKLWRAQRPTTMVVTILALGLRKLRAELRQRVDAWKSIAALEYPSAIAIAPSTYDDALLTQEVPTRLRAVFQSSFSMCCNGTGTQFIRNLRWAIPSPETAASRFKAAAQFAFRVSDVRVITSLSGIGVPYDTDEGITWGQGCATWSDALQAMVTPCECAAPALSDSPGPLKRCSRCYGQVMIGAPLKSAMCGLCGAQANVVCVACSRGIHFEKTVMCQGANKAYMALELDGHVACPDCIWAWTKSLSIRAVVLPTSQQSEVRAIMDKATRALAVRQPSLRRYVKEYVSHHAVTEEELVHVIENLDVSYTKGSGVSKEVRNLFYEGSLELRGGSCRWKVPGACHSRRGLKRVRS